MPFDQAERNLGLTRMRSFRNSWRLIAFLLALGTVWAEPPVTDSTGVLNVKTFGAVGDGQADDTVAIQQAVNAACEIAGKRTMKVRHWRHLTSGMGMTAAPAVVFPAGNYRIRESIVITQPINLRGTGEAVIGQANPARDVFYFHGIRSASVKDLSFRGGRIQLRFWTNNLDVAQIDIVGCRFADARSFAVECRSYTREEFTGKDSELDTVRPWAPYTVTWDNGRPMLIPNPVDHLIGWFNSTLLTISGCEFIQCAGVVDMQCDTGVIEDSRIETSREAGGPVFNLPSGKTHLYRVKGLAHLNPEKDAYWVEGGGILSVRDCDFNTDGADGWNFLRTSRPVRWTSLQIGYFCVELENTRLKAGDSRHNTICWFSKGNQPSILSFRSLTETSGKPVQAAVWEEPPTEKMLHGLLPPNNPLDIPVWFRIQSAGNSPNISLTLPDILAPTLEPSIPDAVLKKAEVSRLSWDFEDLKKKTVRTIAVQNFGVQPDGKEDVSAAIQKVFDEANQAGPALVVFPSGTFRISRTIKLPPRVVVEAAGNAIIVGTDPERALFAADVAEAIGFRGFLFDGGRDGFDLSGSVESEGRVAFQDCSFMDQGKIAIRYLAGGENNRSEISVTGGIFGTMQALVTDASRSQIRRAYLINDPHLNKAAFIENRGGAMRLEACLGIPQLWEGRRNKRPEKLKSWDFSRNTRWVDNFGWLEILDTRLGGESGGMANVFHRAEGGSVFVGGGTTWFFNGLTKKAMVYLEKLPEAVVLQNVSSVPVSIEGSSAVLTNPWMEPNSWHFFHAGLLSPLLPKMATHP